MANTQFIVDLGHLQLIEEQKINISAANQKATAEQLVNVASSNRLALFPVVGDGPKFSDPIIYGIIAHP